MASRSLPSSVPVHQFQLSPIWTATASNGYLSYLKSDKNGVKGKVGILNKYNKTRCLANLMQINWSKVQSQLELSLAQYSPSLFDIFYHYIILLKAFLKRFEA